MLNVYPILAFSDNYIWIIVNSENKNAIVIDPGQALPVIDYITENNLILDYILITHHHFDHTGGVAELTTLYRPKVFGPKNDNIPDLDVSLEHNTEIFLDNFLNLTFTIIEIPGHTKGHIAYYGNNMLFCGDTLFSAGCGRLFEGTAAQMLDSLNKLASLPEITTIYPAHEYTQHNLLFAKKLEPNSIDVKERLEKVKNLREKNLPSLPSTIEIELKTNPFLRCEMPDIIKQASNYAGKKLKNKLEVFTQIRQWKDNF